MIRFTSYNVLSSHLSDATSHTGSNPAHLDPAYRFELVKARMEREMQSDAIIGLQEVSHQWAGKLHAFFASKGYYFVTGLYGSKSNGYMGVGIAVPLKKYEITDVNIIRIADTKHHHIPKKPSSMWKDLFMYVLKWLTSLWTLLKQQQHHQAEPAATDSISIWESALSRSNQMVSLRLRMNKRGAGARRFTVSTYHMPCMFKLPQGRYYFIYRMLQAIITLLYYRNVHDMIVMTIHSALAAQHAQKYARDDPCVLMGDFNFMPGSPQYDLLTKGDMDAQHPDYPPLIETIPGARPDEWTPTLKEPFHSCYVTKRGAEPDFTNYSKFQETPIFIETLDYIFHSRGWRVDDVLALPDRTAVDGPLPNRDEPSDHLLLSATMSLR